MLHSQDMIEGVTVCLTCHQQRHPGRSLTTSEYKVNTETWCAIPRMLKVDPNSSKIARTGSISLVTYQIIFGIGWHLMNGNIEERMLTINRRNFARLIGKVPGTSFNKSFETSLQQLDYVGIVCGYHITGNIVELHICPEYLKMLEENPWFVPLSEINTNSMVVLCLRLWLGMQSGRHNYYIGLEKLMGHIGITNTEKFKAVKTIKKALKQISWAKMEKGEESLHFTLSSKRPTPIRPLRTILTDVLQLAK